MPALLLSFYQSTCLSTNKVSTRKDEYAICNSGGLFIEVINNVSVLSFWLFSHFTFFKACIGPGVSAKPLLFCGRAVSFSSCHKCLFGSETVSESFAMTQESSDCDLSNLYWKLFPEAGIPDWECIILCSHELYWQALRCDKFSQQNSGVF